VAAGAGDGVPAVGGRAPGDGALHTGDAGGQPPEATAGPAVAANEMPPGKTGGTGGQMNKCHNSRTDPYMNFMRKYLHGGVFRVGVACLLAALFIGDLVAGAQEGGPVTTKTVDGFYIGVIGSDFSTNNTFVTNRLSFGIWTTTTTNENSTIYIPTEPEYIYRIQLFYENNTAMPKTSLGEQVGTRFFDLDTSFAENKKKGAQLRRERAVYGQEWGLQFMFFPSRPGHGGKPIYSPSDLFEIDKPGKYRLEISFQVLIKNGSSPTGTAQIIRFPPIEYPLVKR